MQIIRFVKSLVIGGIFFSMLLSISTVNDKMHNKQYEMPKSSKNIVIDLHEKNSHEILLQSSPKAATCKPIDAKEPEIIISRTKTYTVRKPRSYINFSIFNPPKFS